AVMHSATPIEAYASQRLSYTAHDSKNATVPQTSTPYVASIATQKHDVVLFGLQLALFSGIVALVRILTMRADTTGFLYARRFGLISPAMIRDAVIIAAMSGGHYE
ncbi:MAG TPA: hypothetical protein VHK27_15800, partial [Gammaproteobacteria bacterium]|nr:hypothetical protein [Gammaproteobacteria bacterium]